MRRGAERPATLISWRALISDLPLTATLALTGSGASLPSVASDEWLHFLISNGFTVISSAVSDGGGTYRYYDLAGPAWDSSWAAPLNTARRSLGVVRVRPEPPL
jgi:hypothetical protein